MNDDNQWIYEIPLAAFLRWGRATFGTAMRGTLERAGYDDLPRNGLYVIGALARGTAPLSQIIEELRVSKQAAGQLVDTLVLRGYLSREVDPQDRRRLTVTLTERGRAAAAIQRKEGERIEAELTRRLSPEHIAHTRETLALLSRMGFADRDVS
jgi:DNA-binding MarR family transcriptional regulator